MNKPKFSGVFGYLQAIVLSNVVGTVTSFIVAFLVFWQKQSDVAEGVSSIADNALSVSSFLFFGGLTYSMIVISPVVFVLKKQKKTQQQIKNNTKSYQGFGYTYKPFQLNLNK